MANQVDLTNTSKRTIILNVLLVSQFACLFIIWSAAAGDAEGGEADMAEELPLCCCRMETPSRGGSLSTLGQTCMAMDSSDGMVKYIISTLFS